MVKFSVKPFDWTSVKANRIFALFGRRGSGKSVMERWMTWKLDNLNFDKTGKKRWDFGIGVSPTRESQTFFKEIFGFCLTRDKFDKELIHTAIQISKALDKRKKKRTWLVNVDDCGYDKDALKGEIMRDLFMNGRQYNADVIYAFQYCMDLTTDMRAQIDYVICFREPSLPNRERLWKNFGGVFGTLSEFSKVLEACTQDNEVMIIDNTSKSSNPADCVFFTKASMHVPPYVVGRPIFRMLTDLAFIQDDKYDILSSLAGPSAGTASEGGSTTGGSAPPAGKKGTVAAKRKRGETEDSITEVGKMSQEDVERESVAKRAKV